MGVVKWTKGDCGMFMDGIFKIGERVKWLLLESLKEWEVTGFRIFTLF